MSMPERLATLNPIREWMVHRRPQRPDGVTVMAIRFNKPAARRAGGAALTPGWPTLAGLVYAGAGTFLSSVLL